MPNRVFKFELQETTVLRLPVGAQIVSVDNQNGKVCMWVVGDFPNYIPCNPNQSEGEFVHRKFGVYLTGQYIPHEHPVAIGTVLLDGGSFVAHVFELV